MMDESYTEGYGASPAPLFSSDGNELLFCLEAVGRRIKLKALDPVYLNSHPSSITYCLCHFRDLT